jgi:2-polyprenyl-6-methoxyphenol hydroxylase-like FAD-dependent oxidoreductase
MNPSKKAIVIGGSIGGLFAANLLLRAGWDVHIYEQVAAELESRGAGIVTHPELLDALREAGVIVDASLGIQVQERITLNTDGSRIGTLHYPQILTAWGRLFALLSAAFPAERYHAGKVLSAFHQDSNSVTAQFADGESVSADLLIAADGLRSIVRQTLVANASPHYAGYIAWRGMVEESVLSERALKEMFPYFAFGLPEHEQMIAYPVAGKNNTVEPGKRRYNFVWYRPMPQGDELRNILTDADGNHYTQGIPPHKVSWRQIAKAREDARNLLSPQFAEILEKTAQPFLQPIYDLASDQVVSGRIAIMGDAAFVARPHIGMGVTKAAEDAVAISKAIELHGASAKALMHYSEQRLKAGQMAVERARWLGDYVKSTGNSAELVAQRQHLVLNETAIDLGRYGHQSVFKQTGH